jgi:Ser/Thr protein kinase RdoA (MazF antagonist)
MKLQPENQLVHSLNIVASLGKRYDIVVDRYSEAASGIENTTLVISSGDSRYVFRIYRHGKKTNEQIAAELEFMAYLGNHSVPVASIRANNEGGLITLFESGAKSWQAIVMDFVEGEHPKELTNALLTDIATTQAQMHLSGADYHAQTEVIRQLDTLVETEFIKQIDLKSLDDELRAFFERGAAYNLSLSPDLPCGPCHLDYDEQNMLCRDDALVAVLDFDDMAIAPFAICLAYTLWHVQDSYGQAAADAYLSVYQQLRTLTQLEQQLLPAAMLFRHYMITAIKVLDNQISQQDIHDYLQTEQFLQQQLNS